MEASACSMVSFWSSVAKSFRANRITGSFRCSTGGLTCILDQAGGFREPADKVHALDGLAAGAFDEVVFRTHHDEPARPRIQSPGDLDEIGPDDVLGVGQIFAFQQPDE